MKHNRFQFDVEKWIASTRFLCPESKGAWIDILCALQQDKNRGRLTIATQDLSRYLGIPESRLLPVLNKLNGVCTVNVTHDVTPHVTQPVTHVTIEVQSIVKEFESKEKTMLRVKNHRVKKSKALHYMLQPALQGRYSAESVTHDVTPPVTHDKSSTIDSLFELFWQAYPRKVGKDAAKKKFTDRKPNDAFTEMLIKAIELQKHSEQWQKDGGQFIPHPSTWLHQARWLDMPMDTILPKQEKRGILSPDEQIELLKRRAISEVGSE